MVLTRSPEMLEDVHKRNKVTVREKLSYESTCHNLSSYLPTNKTKLTVLKNKEEKQ